LEEAQPVVILGTTLEEEAQNFGLVCVYGLVILSMDVMNIVKFE
jgi:hypothetical protein